MLLLYFVNFSQKPVMMELNYIVMNSAGITIASLRHSSSRTTYSWSHSCLTTAINNL